MDQVVVQEQLCEKCGADIRPESSFCYNCGERVAKEHNVAPEIRAGNIGDIIPASKDADEAVTDREKDAFRRPGDLANEGLRSASTLNRRARSFERKPVEVVWEPLTETNDRRLVMATVIVLILAVVIIGLALYVK